MAEVQTLDGAILWLWKKHNEVNIRLAGKISWLEVSNIGCVAIIIILY